MRGGTADLSQAEVDRRVQVRMTRQDVLDGDQALKLRQGSGPGEFSTGVSQPSP